MLNLIPANFSALFFKIFSREGNLGREGRPQRLIRL